MPGTNVAVLTALAHVIVTEGLVDEAFVRERCDWSEFEEWAAFVALPKNSPEATAIMTGVDPKELRDAARLFATGGNGAIYYGLGVTEHSQGSTTVIAIANLAMATGNIGRPGVGVNPLRGQNNVQGSCDMGSFPHELPGYRHISGDAVRESVRGDVERQAQPGAGPAHSQHVRRRDRRHLHGPLRAGRGHPAVRSQHQACGGGAVGDGMRHRPRPLPQRDRELRPRLPAGIDLPREGRHLHQRRAPHPARPQGDDAAQRLADWEVTIRLAKAMGFEMHYDHPSQIMDEIAALTPTFAGVSYAKLDELGSVQWPCNEKAPEGTPVMHIGGFVRGKGKFVITEYIPTDERTGPRYPLLLTTGRILSQYNVGAQTRRTENVVWHSEDRLEIHPHDAEQRGVRDGDWVRLASRAGETTLRALITDRVAPGVVYTTFHHPDTQANVITTDYLRLGDQLSGIQGHGGADLAVERSVRMAEGLRRAGPPLAPHRAGGSRGVTDARPGPHRRSAGLARRQPERRHAPDPGGDRAGADL